LQSANMQTAKANTNANNLRRMAKRAHWSVEDEERFHYLKEIFSRDGFEGDILYIMMAQKWTVGAKAGVKQKTVAQVASLYISYQWRNNIYIYADQR
jgi:hypothetical protein